MRSTYEVNRHDVAINPEAYKCFIENGYVVLTGFMTPEEARRVRTIVTFLCNHELHSKKSHNYGAYLQRVWNLLNKHSIFHELLLSPQIDLWMNGIFDRETAHRKYYLSSFQANVLQPGARAQILHIDTPVPNPVPNYPLKANTIWLLDDFTAENGATEVIPGSHRRPARPPKTPTPCLEKELKQVIAPMGSVVITHGALWHRSGNNDSSKPRSVLLGSFAASYLREIACEEDAARFLLPNIRKNCNPKLLDMVGENHGVKPGNDYCIPGFFSTNDISDLSEITK
jgi:ectoine hydroxylase-related dioxygenase (phytanoyl-CoA dioxygenase family)